MIGLWMMLEMGGMLGMMMPSIQKGGEEVRVLSSRKDEIADG